MGSAWDADEIARDDFDGKHRAGVRMNVEQPAAFDDEPNLVFVVPVLAVELVEHDLQVRRVREHINHVGRHIAAADLELVDLFLVGVEQFLSRRASRNVPSGLGTFVVDAL